MISITKLRIALIAVTALFLILIGYLLYLSYLDYYYEWTVETLIVGSFAFFGTFTFTSYNILFVTLLSFGIFVLPFVFGELGFLDDDSAEMVDAETIEGEESFDRFAGFLKSRFASIKKIRNYSLPIGIMSAIFGGCLMMLPSFLLIDSEPVWIPELEDNRAAYFVEEYYGFIRGQLLLIGILLLVVGLILIIRYIRRNS
ncbi:MAG: hypothetical protein D4S01_01340 [Dehalococcoidia bacterium]|nr:MAG: hypothetical protein D4S01_01340 [Dehalococcoidia bacterium]